MPTEAMTGVSAHPACHNALRLSTGAKRVLLGSGKPQGAMAILSAILLSLREYSCLNRAVPTGIFAP